MGRTGVFCLLALAVPLIGCRGQDPQDYPVEEREPYEEQFTQAATREEYQTDDPVPMTPVQGGEVVGGGLTATGSLVGPPGQPSPGTLTVTEQNGQTRVSLNVRQAAGAELQMAVMQGPCERPTRAVYTHGEPVVAGPEGLATFDDTIPLPAATVLNGEHSLRLTVGSAVQGAADVDALVGCANLPAVRSPAGAR